MQARAMPIYWGNPRIAAEFNPKSFLNYFDFPSEEALIEKIIELDQDDAKYLEYLRQPYFHNNRPNEFFSRERLLNQFENDFHDARHAGFRPAVSAADRPLDNCQEKQAPPGVKCRRNNRFCAEWARLRNGLAILCEMQ